jgi:BFD-like [2Fe-2S] binding domain
LPALADQPRKLGEATTYTVTLARRRVPIRHRSIVAAAHGTDQLEAVTVGRLDRTGALKSATLERIPVDVFAVGYGFIPQPELPLTAGCAMHTGADQTLAVTTDARQGTTNPRVFAAGETTGVGGAQLAVAEGILAGAAAAQAAGSRVYGSRQRLLGVTARRDRLRRFASAMHAVYPVPAVWMDHLEPDTIVCRCEEVTVADINGAVDLGARDARTVRLLSRSGMGWCRAANAAMPPVACWPAALVKTPTSPVVQDARSPPRYRSASSPGWRSCRLTHSHLERAGQMERKPLCGSNTNSTRRAHSRPASGFEPSDLGPNRSAGRSSSNRPRR